MKLQATVAQLVSFQNLAYSGGSFLGLDTMVGFTKGQFIVRVGFLESYVNHHVRMEKHHLNHQ